MALNRWRSASSKGKVIPSRILPDPHVQRPMESPDEPFRLGQSTGCLIPGFDGSFFMPEWKEALWARFFTGALGRQR
jgi:hypothetical protein